MSAQDKAIEAAAKILFGVSHGLAREQAKSRARACILAYLRNSELSEEIANAGANAAIDVINGNIPTPPLGSFGFIGAAFRTMRQAEIEELEQSR